MLSIFCGTKTTLEWINPHCSTLPLIIQYFESSIPPSPPPAVAASVYANYFFKKQK